MPNQLVMVNVRSLNLMCLEGMLSLQRTRSPLGLHLPKSVLCIHIILISGAENRFFLFYIWIELYIYIYIYIYIYTHTVNCGKQVDQSKSPSRFLAQNSGLDQYPLYWSTSKSPVSFLKAKTYPVSINEDRLWQPLPCCAIQVQ